MQIHMHYAWEDRGGGPHHIFKDKRWGGMSSGLFVRTADLKWNRFYRALWRNDRIDVLLIPLPRPSPWLCLQRKLGLTFSLIVHTSLKRQPMLKRTDSQQVIHNKPANGSPFRRSFSLKLPCPLFVLACASILHLLMFRPCGGSSRRT